MQGILLRFCGIPHRAVRSRRGRSNADETEWNGGRAIPAQAAQNLQNDSFASPACCVSSVRRPPDDSFPILAAWPCDVRAPPARENS